MTSEVPSLLKADTAFGFLSAATSSGGIYNPVLIANEAENTMLRAIRNELRRSQKFTFSVAFVTTGSIAILKQALLDYQGTGTIITSTYLGFNSPEMFRELLSLPRVKVYLHPGDSGGFHAKGYVFEQAGSTTAIIGSSNLTVRALLENKEWNLRFSALPGGDITDQIKQEVQKQLNVSQLLSSDWIDDYERHYVAQARSIVEDQPAALNNSTGFRDSYIVPNRMQLEALESIEKVRSAGESRALIVSATGTGKTILSALDVRAMNPDRVLFIAHREQILDRSIEAFRQVLGAPEDEFGKFVGPRKEVDRKYVFATIQSISRDENLRDIRPDHFDYVLIDEVHRAGAESYRALIEWLSPKFLLGLTATPERTDEFNVFELFDFNVPYEIRLQAALEADMLVPFHYYGVTDFVDSEGRTIEETSELSRLVNEERVLHLAKVLRDYGHAGETRGLIFCSRREEAIELSRLLNRQDVNGDLLRTVPITGTDSIERRNQAVEKLERGQLDYIVTVDVFNEGIDIPSLNQIVMLRQTQSSIIFTQQLGRGLRKASGKDHLRVIDFIGNYTNNYLIPIALLGDSSLNKDAIRKKLVSVESAGAIAGLSSINFDPISRERILESLASVSLDGMKNLKAAYLQLEQRLGGVPMLIDFARFDTVDPVLIATKAKTYWSFLSKLKKSASEPDLNETAVLSFLSSELMNGKRPHELILLDRLRHAGPISRNDYMKLLAERGCNNSEATVDSVLRVLTLDFFTSSERIKYGDSPAIEFRDGLIVISALYEKMLQASADFCAHFDDALETGIFLARHRHNWSGELQEGHLYSRKDVCRLLNWHSNEYSTMYGYKVDHITQTCPIFVTYHKDEDVSASTQYEDELIDSSTMKWYTRSRRTLKSPEVQSIVANNIPLHLFAKKDDAEGTEFFYLGQANSREPVQEKMPDDNGKHLDVVTMKLDLKSPMEESLYRYFVDSRVA